MCVCHAEIVLEYIHNIYIYTYICIYIYTYMYMCVCVSVLIYIGFGFIYMYAIYIMYVYIYTRQNQTWTDMHRQLNGILCESAYHSYPPSDIRRLPCLLAPEKGAIENIGK